MDIKMKRKYYLRGIGIGIIFAAIIMSIAYNTSYKNKISDEEVIKKAKELGMVFEDETSNIDELLTTITPSPTEEATVKEPEPEKEPEVTVTPTKEPEKEEVEQAEGEEPEPDKDGESEETQDAEDQKVVIEITAGMSSEGVAKLLKSKGIIEDAAAFNQYLILNEYTKDIRIGTYEIEPYLSYKEITDKIIFK